MPLDGTVAKFIRIGIYSKKVSIVTVLVLYVDDLLIFGSSNFGVAEIKLQLGAKFKIKDLGLVNRYLGIDFDRSANGDSISASTNIHNRLDL